MNQALSITREILAKDEQAVDSPASSSNHHASGVRQLIKLILLKVHHVTVRTEIVELLLCETKRQ